MKKAKDDKRIQTMCEGVYEGGILNKELRKNQGQELNKKTTDLQGNGYPVPKAQKEE